MSPTLSVSGVIFDGSSQYPVDWQTEIPAGQGPSADGRSYHRFFLGQRRGDPWVRPILFPERAMIFTWGQVSMTDRNGQRFTKNDSLTKENSPVRVENRRDPRSFVEISYSSSAKERQG